VKVTVSRTSNAKTRVRSRTFVIGPHTTDQECLRKIAEINPPPAKKIKAPASR